VSLPLSSSNQGRLHSPAGTTMPMPIILTNKMADIMRAINKAITMDTMMTSTMTKELAVSSNTIKVKDGEEAMIPKRTRRRSATSR
jgi:hypothetical protein